MRNILIFGLILALSFSCSDWTKEETVEIEKKTPHDTEEYRQYLQGLRSYKQTDHYIVHVRLDNAPEISTSEKDFMRAIPDSVDIITLYNSATLSRYDIEDMPVVQEKGTKIMYYIDYAKYKEGGTSLEGFLSSSMEIFDRYGFDGITLGANIDFSGDVDQQHADAEVIVNKISGISGPLVFEGNPLFVPASLRDKFDYYILNTSTSTHTSQLEASIRYARENAGIPYDKMVLAAGPSGPKLTGYIHNSNNQPQDAIVETARCVVGMGPLAGISIINVSDDYYYPALTYKFTRWAINILNNSN